MLAAKRNKPKIAQCLLEAGADKAEIQPGWVDLTVKGPQRVLHNLALGEAAVYVDASGLAPGSHQLDVRVDLPAALELVRTAPDKQVVRIGGGGGH